MPQTQQQAKHIQRKEGPAVSAAGNQRVLDLHRQLLDIKGRLKLIKAYRFEQDQREKEEVLQKVQHEQAVAQLRQRQEEQRKRVAQLKQQVQDEMRRQQQLDDQVRNEAQTLARLEHLLKEEAAHRLRLVRQESVEQEAERKLHQQAEDMYNETKQKP